jgi:site-specific DNA-methyltransferase (adenine-specific)
MVSHVDVLLEGDAAVRVKELEKGSVDLLVTDAPYGLQFAGKDWDKAVPSVEVWKGCEQALKPGAFAFIMSAPRLDLLSRMALRLQEAGFRIDFTPIFWAFSSGLPKAENISRAVEKRVGVKRQTATTPASDVAKSLDGSYGGFQPKPCLELVLVCQKPMRHKTYLDQSLEWVAQRAAVLGEIEIALRRQGVSKVEWTD